MSKEKQKENGISNTKKSTDNNADVSSNNNNGNDHMNLSPEALERYRKNKEFREKTEIHKSR